MAISLVGGIAVSTFLTLFVVPAAYSLIDDVVEWNRARRRQGTGLVAGIAHALSRRPRTGSSAG